MFKEPKYQRTKGFRAPKLRFFCTSGIGIFLARFAICVCPLILIVSALATAPNDPSGVSAGDALVCDFEEAADRNYDGWPDRWIRRRSRELPEFLEIGIV